MINNCPYPYWDKLDQICWSEYLIKRLEHNKLDRSDVMFINVSYDKQVVDYTYSGGNLTGKIDITNRETLLKFLQVAERINNYKYIFLDIRFEKGINTPVDSALFDQISRMRDISFSRHSDIINKDAKSRDKSAINDYYSTILSSFARYEFLQNGEESIPLRLYSATVSGHPTIKKHGLFYTCNGHLCYNSPFMSIPEDFNEGHDIDGNQNYYDLGPLLLDENFFSDEDWKIETNNKILIVGDFINDLHDTYRGLQPGSFLVYLAYKELVNNAHIVSWTYIFCMFIVYFMIAYAILSNKNWMDLPCVKKITKNKLTHFILGFIGYSLVLTIIGIISFTIFNIVSNVILPSFVFSILTIYKSFKQISK